MLSQRTWAYDSSQLMTDLARKKVLRPEQLVAALPLEYRSNVTFIRNSQSLQKGVRAVLFGGTGDLIITLNKKGAQGDMQAEVLEWNSAARKYLRREVVFDPGGKKPPRLITDQNAESLKKCTGCHGSETLLLWGPYDSWETALGSDDDQASSSDQDLLADLRKDPRFKDLAWSQDNPCWPYYCLIKGKSPEEVNSDPSRHLGNMPNTRLTFITLIRNSLAQAEQAKRHENFPRLARSLAYLSLCRGDAEFNDRFVAIAVKKVQKPAEASASFKAIPRDYVPKEPFAIAWPPLALTEHLFRITPYSREAIARESYNSNWVGREIINDTIFSLLGRQDPSAEIKKGPGNITQIRSEFFMNQNSNQFLAVQLLKALAEYDGEVQEFLRKNTLTDPESLIEYQQTYRGAPELLRLIGDKHFLTAPEKFQTRHKSCDQLKAMAEKELNVLNSAPDCVQENLLESSRLEAALTVEVRAQGRKSLTTEGCISCHDPSGDLAGLGPVIHFSDEAKLAKELDQPAKVPLVRGNPRPDGKMDHYPTVREVMSLRLRGDAGDYQMPPTKKQVPNEVYGAIMQYLDGVR